MLKKGLIKLICTYMWHVDGPYFPVFWEKLIYATQGGVLLAGIFTIENFYNWLRFKAHDRPLLGPLLQLSYLK